MQRGRLPRSLIAAHHATSFRFHAFDGPAFRHATDAEVLGDRLVPVGTMRRVVVQWFDDGRRWRCGISGNGRAGSISACIRSTNRSDSG